MVEQLRYQPLNNPRREIRSLAISSASKLEDELVCELRTVPLELSLNYTALSYVWGDPKITEIISINGQYFAARTNLCIALKYIRKQFATHSLPRGTPCWLWVDAICINQRDTQERNVQVQQMNAIYRFASYVLSFLGSGDSRVDFAMQMMQPYGAKRVPLAVLLFTQNASAWPSSEVDSGETVLTHLIEADIQVQSKLEDVLGSTDTRSKLNELCQAISAFIALPYWHRLWIVQEVVSAKPTKNIIMYGDAWTTFEDIHNSSAFFGENIGALERLASTSTGTKERFELKHYKIYFQSFWIRMQVLQYLRHGSGIRNPARVLWMPLQMREYDRTNDWDAVYALLGLTSSDLLEINYLRPVEEVYTDWFSRLLESTPILLLLFYAGLGREGRPRSDLPSWVPDLREKSSDWLCGVLRKPCRESPLELHDRVKKSDLKITGGRILHVTLAWVDTVTKVTIICGELESGKSLRRFCLDFLAKNLGGWHKSGMAPIVALFMTLYEGNVRSLSPRDVEFSTKSDSQLFPDLFPIPFKIAHPLDRSACVLRFVSFLLRDKDNDCEIEEDALEILRLHSEEKEPVSSILKRFFPHEEAVNIPAWSDNLGQLTEKTYVPPSLEAESWNPFCDRAFPDILTEHELTLSGGFTIYETETGYLGKGPPGIKAGDRICASEDTEISFAIREKGSEFLLVGSTYVAGVSDGQAREMIAAGNILVEEIPLS